MRNISFSLSANCKTWVGQIYGFLWSQMASMNLKDLFTAKNHLLIHHSHSSDLANMFKQLKLNLSLWQIYLGPVLPQLVLFYIKS